MNFILFFLFLSDTTSKPQDSTEVNIERTLGARLIRPSDVPVPDVPKLVPVRTLDRFLGRTGRFVFIYIMNGKEIKDQQIYVSRSVSFQLSVSLHWLNTDLFFVIRFICFSYYR